MEGNNMEIGKEFKYRTGITIELLNKLVHGSGYRLRFFAHHEKVRIYAPRYFIGMYIDDIMENVEYIQDKQLAELGKFFRGIKIECGYENKLVFVHEDYPYYLDVDLKHELVLRYDPSFLAK